MPAKVALIVVYNHHPHADNIPVVERLYGARFSDIYHLVPCARGFAPVATDGDGPNIIPVHGKSWHFHGWFAQGLRRYFRARYTHYFFIHDDLLLNPAIDENNFREHLNLQLDDTAFTTNFYTLHQRLEWNYAPEAYRFRGRIAPLPAVDEARRRFAAHGLRTGRVGFNRRLFARGVYVPPPPPRGCAQRRASQDAAALSDAAAAAGATVVAVARGQPATRLSIGRRLSGFGGGAGRAHRGILQILRGVRRRQVVRRHRHADRAGVVVREHQHPRRHSAVGMALLAA